MPILGKNADNFVDGANTTEVLSRLVCVDKVTNVNNFSFHF